MARIDSFLELVVEQKASDLHFHGGSPPLIRHDGDLVTLPFRVLTESEVWRFLHEILAERHLAELEKNWDVDFVYEIAGLARFRVNVFRQHGGVGGVFRVIPNVIPRLGELSLPPAAKKLIEFNNGLVLVTGPTGSGKTTTLAALVDEINRNQERHVITIEDPIEFVHTSSKSLITQREVGTHVDSFSSALRSALREAPDVLVVGEMRDLETMQLALSAAETGVLVFGTLHTSSAGKSIDRVIDMSPEEGREQIRGVLSVLLRGVLAQNLCRRASGDGRVPISELLLQNYGVASIIRENKMHQLDSFLAAASHDGSGMQSMDTSILRYIRDGEITLEDGLPYAVYPDVVKSQAAAYQAGEDR